MASATKPRQTVETPREAERLVDEQIRQTRRALKIVDLSAGMLTLVIGVIIFLLTAAVLEHWVIPGGWSIAARTILFVLLLLGSAWYSCRVFWPLLRRPINAAYAAQTIEQSSPALKNSLLNFLLLRNRKRLISRQVFQAIEQQAAQGLSKVSLDSVVDRSTILQLSYVLLTVVAICALYLLFSPKDLVASAERVLLPWSHVAVPSRVQLHDIMPGDSQAARGDQIEVSAEVLGLAEDEPVRLLYSTADKQIVGQEILMTAETGSVLFKAKLPGRMSQKGGVQQDFSYWIEAGDARSARYQVSVFARPTLVVQNVRYNYPDYTGYPSREEAYTGDISAVEGTVVTITAISNQQIQSGHVDFDANGRHDLLMKVEENRQASISFPLELREDRRTPRYQSYVLRYTTTEGRKNKLPPKYQIDVTPDYSPEIRLLSPEEEVVDVLLDEQITIEVEARDPDFAVQKVAILGEVGGKKVLKERLLSKNYTGRFVGRMELSPSQLGLQVGDVLEYWGVAADNRRPKANLAFTLHRKIRVVGPDEESKQGAEPPKNGEEQGEGQSTSGKDQQNESDQGSKQDSDDSAGESEGEGQQGQGQSGAGEDGEGMSDEQNQSPPGEGQAGEGESNEKNEDSQADSEGQAGENSEDKQEGEQEGEQQKDETSQNEGGESGSNSSAPEKVSPDGDDDGTAFDRIAEHFNEQQSEDAGDDAELNEQDRGGEGRPSENNSDAVDGSPDSDQSDHGESGEPAAADGGEDEDTSEKGEQSPDEEAPGGEMPQEQGPAGTEGDQEGAPEPQGDKSPQEKQGEQGASGKLSDQAAPSESKDQSESDTKGSDGGDRSGEGSEGSGQESEGAGTGSEGEHQAADEGGGQADQPGEGNMSAEPGGDKQAEGETGKSSQDQPGNGSEQGGQSGKQAGEQAGGADQGENGENQGQKGPSQQDAAGKESPDEGPSQKSDGKENSSAPAGQQPSGGGQSGKSSPPRPDEIQPGDEANLEYARNQTDLILDKLDDQLKKKKTDEKLLEKLGWSKDELRRFVDRWKHLKKQATGETASAAEQQELDDALRSLGLGRNRRTGFHSQTAKDKLRELQDSYRGKIPLKYQQRVRAYIKGTATAEEEK